jgi:type IV pilus assembly protein PilM
MPESMAYSSVISMPVLSEAELASSIHWEAEQHVPIPLEEVNLEYEILFKPKKEDIGEKMRVLIVAARKDSITRLVDLFQTASVEVVGLETTLLAVYRALYPTLQTEGSVMVCHIGALSTDVLITNAGEMMLSYTIQSGGLALTRAIEQGLELPPQQAEEYKRSYGMDQSQLEGKVYQSLVGVINVLVSEIRKAMQFYQSSHMQVPVRSVLLSGGAAYLPGLTAYLAQSLSLEVTVANPLASVTAKTKVPEDIAAYTTAIGLTLRDE